MKSVQICLNSIDKVKSLSLIHISEPTGPY